MWGSPRFTESKVEARVGESQVNIGVQLDANVIRFLCLLWISVSVSMALVAWHITQTL